MCVARGYILTINISFNLSSLYCHFAFDYPFFSLFLILIVFTCVTIRSSYFRKFILKLNKYIYLFLICLNILIDELRDFHSRTRGNIYRRSRTKYIQFLSHRRTNMAMHSRRIPRVSIPPSKFVPSSNCDCSAPLRCSLLLPWPSDKILTVRRSGEKRSSLRARPKTVVASHLRLDTIDSPTAITQNPETFDWTRPNRNSAYLFVAYLHYPIIVKYIACLFPTELCL